MRYITVGTSVNGAGCLSDLALTWAGLSPRRARAVLREASLSESFHIHGHVTFAGGGKNLTTDLRFPTVSLTQYAVNLVILMIPVNGAGFPHGVPLPTSIKPWRSQCLRCFVASPN